MLNWDFLVETEKAAMLERGLEVFEELTFKVKSAKFKGI